MGHKSNSRTFASHAQGPGVTPSTEEKKITDKNHQRAGAVAHVCGPNTQETEAGLQGLVKVSMGYKASYRLARAT